MAKEIERLQDYIATMRNKVRGKNDPGYLHYRVLCDYIRAAIAHGQVSYRALGLAGELNLCLLELECINYALEQKHITHDLVEMWFKNTLEAKIKMLKGGELTHVEEDNVVELFPAQAA